MIDYIRSALCSVVLASGAIIIIGLTAPNNVSAAQDPGRILDDALFLDANIMTKEAIQSFLVSKNSGLANLSYPLQCYGAGSTERQLYTNAGATCDTPIPASHIIYYASQIYGVSPKVILTTMQKEQSLVTSPNPTSWQLNQAMGYACPTSGSCAGNSTFSYQIDNATWALRYHFERARGNMTWWSTSSSWTCGTTKNLYSPNLYPGQNVRFYDTNGTHYATVYIQNATTSAMYCYTPHTYNNPQGLYGRAPYGTTGLYYSGSYNFVSYYELWFGSTLAAFHNGIDYSPVFNAEFYLDRYPDLKQAFGNNASLAFSHFIVNGIQEGRQASASFNVQSYKNRYQDLRINYGNVLSAYYAHFSIFGFREGRVATGTATLVPITKFKGIDYANVYDFNAYIQNHSDMRIHFQNDDAGAIQHFVSLGMREGRLANASFNVLSYKGIYVDLRRAFGEDNKAYYLHYLTNGKKEGRIATGSTVNGTSVLGGVNYASIYNFETYRNNNSDIKRVFGLNDIEALRHFVGLGMSEGRAASSEFNVYTYKTNYADLRQAFGSDLKAYYMHYLTNGKKEGRIAI